MRRTASRRFIKTLELARNVVNITFPMEFGTPHLIKTGSGMAAMFPDNVAMRALRDDCPVTLKPIGEGCDAAAAMIDLFSLFAERECYQDIVVTHIDMRAQQKFIACESPYSTIIFQRCRPDPAANALN